MNRAKVARVRTLFAGASRYQSSAFGRGYVWGPPEIAQLLMDLEDGSRITPQKGADPERLYLGVVTVSPARDGRAMVVDGQQRLAAIAMFLAFARDRAADLRDARKLHGLLYRQSLGGRAQPRLHLAEGEHDWFVRHILTPGATLRLPADAPPGGPRNLLASARFMAGAFNAYSAADIRRLSQFMANHAAVVLARTTEHAQAFRAHLSLNMRAATHAAATASRIHAPSH